MIMKLFPKIEYQSIFSAFGSSTVSWLYNLCGAFRGNLYTDNSIWVLEIIKKKKILSGFFLLPGLSNFIHFHIHS